MAADLRERVARVLAYEAWKDEEFWRGYLPEADAVLAELAPELQPQASAEDVRVMDELVERSGWPGEIPSWQRIRASLEVGK
jgi:hypothetical protein